jgi:hypothetical protein
MSFLNEMYLFSPLKHSEKVFKVKTFTNEVQLSVGAQGALEESEACCNFLMTEFLTLR